MEMDVKLGLGGRGEENVACASQHVPAVVAGAVLSSLRKLSALLHIQLNPRILCRLPEIHCVLWGRQRRRTCLSAHIDAQ